MKYKLKRFFLTLEFYFRTGCKSWGKAKFLTDNYLRE